MKRKEGFKPMQEVKKIHFIGIKGVGMTPLAIFAKEAGMMVSGCDVDETFITDDALAAAGITPLMGFSEEHIIKKDLDLVIATGAHNGYENREVQAALKAGREVVMQGEALGSIMDGKLTDQNYKGISVAGCHGKTTTTAMIATIFHEAGLDPSYIVGTSHIVPIGLPGHYGKSKYFIAEADEYATEPNYYRIPKLLWQHPAIAVLTNVEFDHPDIYTSLDEIATVYGAFIENIKPNGVLVTNGDDPEIQKILKNYKGKVITYGYNKTNDYSLLKIRIQDNQTLFSAASREKNLGDFVLNVIGEHNAMNALAAAIVALEAGISPEDIKKGLFIFKGTKRRSEFVGVTSTGAQLYDDYAHHPTEIQKTLAGMKAQFPDKKILAVFQPHTYSRTKELYNEFSSSFSSAESVIITNIFASAREQVDPSISGEMLSNAIKEKGRDTIFLPTLQDVIQYINKKKLGNDYVVVLMGAGDIYKIADQLLVGDERRL